MVLQSEGPQNMDMKHHQKKQNKALSCKTQKLRIDWVHLAGLVWWKQQYRDSCNNWKRTVEDTAAYDAGARLTSDVFVQIHKYQHTFHSHRFGKKVGTQLCCNLGSHEVSIPPPPRWYLYFDVVEGLAWSNDPESYAGGSIATGRGTHAGQVEVDDPD
jgi:hypothetical protein